MWTKTQLRLVLANGTVEWRKHVLSRMMERGIGRHELLDALRDGEFIETYSADRPYPSALLYGAGPPPLHIVAALDMVSMTCFVITAYRPDETHFEPDLKTRRLR
jgi:hypothetical protein